MPTFVLFLTLDLGVFMKKRPQQPYLLLTTQLSKHFRILDSNNTAILVIYSDIVELYVACVGIVTDTQ